MSDEKTPSADEKRIEALLTERVGYERRGIPERVATVDAELKRLGYVDPEKPHGRASREEKQSTADASKTHDKA